MVGMGAVVTRDVPAFALVVGNPARLAGWVSACGEPLVRAGAGAPERGAGAPDGAGAERDLRCRRCGRDYRFEGGVLRPKAPIVSAP
jgi:hypothetical protein